MGRRSSRHDEGIDELFLDTAIEDSQLRMIFACCHPLLSRENQLALTLKTLCGFGISEIARALLVNEETVKKRLQRATATWSTITSRSSPPDATQLIERLDAVHQVLYLIFNEGHSSSKGETAIRTDLCEDAAYLCHLLCSHPHCSTPTTRALMALMLFHAARLESRLDDQGSILLMEDQDRTRWDAAADPPRQGIPRPVSRGNVHLPFHLEAGIALYHCSATSYAETDWPAILLLYDALLTIHRSPVYLLNRAIVVAEIEGPPRASARWKKPRETRPSATITSSTPRSANSTAARAISTRPGNTSKQPNKRLARLTIVRSSTVGWRDARERRCEAPRSRGRRSQRR